MAHTPGIQDRDNILHTSLSFLPQLSAERILSRLQQAISYEPVIGIMGKSGSGKSSLCNALFQQQVCATSDLAACTREPQYIRLSVENRNLTLVDLPGVGETPEYDKEYAALYQRLLPTLDLIIWVLRIDDRAHALDIATHRSLLEQGADPSRFLFVLSKADLIPPKQPTENALTPPSSEQLLSIAVVSALATTHFPSSFPVIAVSSHSGYNLPAFVELMVYALPERASSAVYQLLREEHRSEVSKETARDDFGKVAGQVFDAVVDPRLVPSGLTGMLKQLRRKLVEFATDLWERIFG